MTKPRSPRLAVRALILIDDRLLLVNAYPGDRSDLWCAPGGGLQAGTSLPDNLAREVHEETGLRITVGDPGLVNEFHDPESGFHQVDLYFRCTAANSLPEDWTDPEGIVTAAAFSPAPNWPCSASSPTAWAPPPGARASSTTRWR